MATRYCESACIRCRKVLIRSHHPSRVRFLTTDYGKGRPSGPRESSREGDSSAQSSSGDKPLRQLRPSRRSQTASQGEAEDDLTRVGKVGAACQRPNERLSAQARTNLRSWSAMVRRTCRHQSCCRHDSSRAGKRGKVAILYVSLDRYGPLEPVFGWPLSGISMRWPPNLER